VTLPFHRCNTENAKQQSADIPQVAECHLLPVTHKKSMTGMAASNNFKGFRAAFSRVLLSPKKQCTKRYPISSFGAKGSLKNNFTFYAPMQPVWLRCENSESAASDSCVFAPCPTGASTLKIVNLFFRES
jgi:hypothetical protein